MHDIAVVRQEWKKIGQMEVIEFIRDHIFFEEGNIERDDLLERLTKIFPVL